MKFFSTLLILSILPQIARAQIFVAGYFSVIDSYHASGNAWSNFCCSGNPVLALALDENGTLYSVSSGHGSYPFYDIYKWSVAGVKDPNFHIQSTITEQAMEADESGHLYVGNSQTGSVMVYDSAGNLLNPSFLSGLQMPLKFQLDGQGNIYVANKGNCSIGKYSLSGAAIAPSLISVPGCNGYFKFTLDNKGHVYTVSWPGFGTGTIGKYTISGAVVNPALISLANPSDIAIAPDGNLLVLTYDATVQKYTPDGILLNDSFAVVPANAICISVPTLRIKTADSQFGVRTNGFSFNVAGSAEQIVTVETSTNPAAAFWIPLQTNTLGLDPWTFVDADWTNSTVRFYRASGH